MQRQNAPAEEGLDRAALQPAEIIKSGSYRLKVQRIRSLKDSLAEDVFFKCRAVFAEEFEDVLVSAACVSLLDSFAEQIVSEGQSVRVFPYGLAA